MPSATPLARQCLRLEYELPVPGKASSYVCLYDPQGFVWWLNGKESTCNAGDPGEADSIPGFGRSPGGGIGNTFQQSCLGNPMDRGSQWATVHGVAKELKMT